MTASSEDEFSKDRYELIEKLKSMQAKCHSYRFHLILEKDKELGSHRAVGTEVEILFSPTIDFRRKETMKLSESLVIDISLFAKHMLRAKPTELGITVSERPFLYFSCAILVNQGNFRGQRFRRQRRNSQYLRYPSRNFSSYRATLFPQFTSSSLPQGTTILKDRRGILRKVTEIFTGT